MGQVDFQNAISHFSRRFSVGIAFFAAFGIGKLSGNTTFAANVTADAVVNYSAGSAPTTYQNPARALGVLNGDTGYGGMNPFNPTYSATELVIAGEGGSLTLHLSGNVPTNGINLGVYSNVGMYDNAADVAGTGLANTPADLYNQASRAVVSVSQDGTIFQTLNGGAPITFSNPANYYTDTPLNLLYQTIGAQHASQFKPFRGNLSSFDGKTYDQMKTVLNNSAGGTWLDLRGTSFTSINYVKFDVPTGSGDRMVVDAIGALGAVNSISGPSRVISENVGTGAHSSHIIIDFGPQSYDFNVHYNYDANGHGMSGTQALQLLAANSDFRATIQSFPFGNFVTGLDYGGFVQIGDGSAGNNYWGYYLGDGTSWTSSSIGSDTRLLTEGSYDGWVWTPLNAGNPAFATVPEPTTGMLLGIGSSLLLIRRRKIR